MEMSSQIYEKIFCKIFYENPLSKSQLLHENKQMVT
jgi:hypothetical protein